LTSLTYKQGGNVIGNLTYEYDKNGRRTQMGGSFARSLTPKTLSSATYNAANQQLDFGGQTLSYDLNGNLTSDGANTYTWDARNQLSAVTSIGLNASFQYDSRGQRVGKTVNGTTTNFLYNGANTVQEQSAQTGTANILAGGIDEFFLRTDSSGSWSPLFDGLGSSVSLTDATGATQTEYAYGAFGQSATSGSDNNNSAQYTGRENDGTGLQYNRARYYSSTLQRFISEDPLGFGGGDINLYAYTSNSPTNFTDPSGLSTGGARARLSSIAARKLNVDYVLGFIANEAAGFGDRFGDMCVPDYVKLFYPGFNPVRFLRDLTPGGATIDYSSSAYRNGGDNATIVTFVLGVGAAGGGSEPSAGPDRTIYRGGGTNPGNFKPGSDGGVSFRDSLSNPYPLEPGQQPVFGHGAKWSGINTGDLPPGSVRFDGGTGRYAAGHVSVRGVAPATLSNAAKGSGIGGTFPK
jgi:RHS repeat-associated protein